MSTTWNSAFELVPANSDAANGGADRIRTLKSAIRERFEKEHHMDLGSGTLTDDGYHLHGSAVAWYQATEPTTSPDGTALGAKDKGRIWIDSDDKNPYIYTGSAFVAMIADDADKVSGYGIGVDGGSVISFTGDFRTLYKCGLYYATTAATNGPVAANNYSVLVLPGSSSTTSTIIVNNRSNGKTYWGYANGGAAISWNTVWDSVSDGPGSGLDADTASGCGIGTSSTLRAVSNMNTLDGDGIMFATTNSCTGAPAAGYWSCFQIYINGNSLYKTQYAVSQAGAVYARGMSGGTWNTWQCLSDGLNGGQPPAPKPKAYSSNANSEWINVDTGTGNGYTTPNVAGSLWCGILVRRISASNLIPGSLSFAEVAGNTVVLSPTAGETIFGFVWRTT